MELRSITYFLAVAEGGSVSAAAAATYVSQPAVSRQIAALEREMGVRLFRRTPSGMRLTPAGERFRAMARDIQIRVRRAEGVMGALHEGRLEFHVACPETTANFFLIPYVAATGAPIADVHPARPEEVYGRLAQGIDLAVGTSVPPAHLESLRVLSTPILVQYPAGSRPDWVEEGGDGRRRVELGRLASERIVMPGYGSAVGTGVHAAARARGLTLDLARATTNGTMAQAMAAAGHGFAVVSEPVQFGLERAVLHDRDRPMTMELYVAWEPDHYAAPEIRALAEGLAAWMPGVAR